MHLIKLQISTESPELMKSFVHQYYPAFRGELIPISCHWSFSVPPENIRAPGFLLFSGGKEKDQCHEIGQVRSLFLLISIKYELIIRLHSTPIINIFSANSNLEHVIKMFIKPKLEIAIIIKR